MDLVLCSGIETPLPARWALAFDRVWTTLAKLYYSRPPASAEWEALARKHRLQAEAAETAAAFEDVVSRPPPLQADSAAGSAW